MSRPTLDKLCSNELTCLRPSWSPESKILVFIRNFLLAAALVCTLAGCATVSPEYHLPTHAESSRIADLEASILALDDSIAPAEARRAARVAIRYSHQLAQEYEVTDSPLMHNIKVNMGLRERGLCIDWTSDLLRRLYQEEFETLDLHWAIANYRTVFRLEHSTVVVSAVGQPIEQGLILDPWRYSGRLYWSQTLADSGYVWEPQADILELKRQRKSSRELRPGQY